MLKRSLPPVVRSDARLLVLGSLPGDRSLAEARYYAHPQNQFWQLMSPVIGRDLLALDYSAKLAALAQARVGLWDVVGAARRPGSTDAAILNISVNDVAGLIATLPDLRAVAFNGGTALKHGRRLIGPSFAGAIVALPSSSPLHTIGRAAKQPAWDGLRAWL